MPVEYRHSWGAADHTLHFHALFTSSLGLAYAFTSAGHKQARDQWMTEIKYLCPSRSTEGRSHDRRASQKRNFLPHTPSEEGEEKLQQQQHRWGGDNKGGLCEIYRGSRKMLSAFYSICCRASAVLIHCLLFCFAPRKMSVSYCAEHWTGAGSATVLSVVFSQEIFTLYKLQGLMCIYSTGNSFHIQDICHVIRHCCTPVFQWGFCLFFFLFFLPIVFISVLGCWESTGPGKPPRSRCWQETSQSPAERPS